MVRKSVNSRVYFCATVFVIDYVIFHICSEICAKWLCMICGPDAKWDKCLTSSHGIKQEPKFMQPLFVLLQSNLWHLIVFLSNPLQLQLHVFDISGDTRKCLWTICVYSTFRTDTQSPPNHLRVFNLSRGHAITPKPFAYPSIVIHANIPTPFACLQPFWGKIKASSNYSKTPARANPTQINNQQLLTSNQLLMPVNFSYR